MPKQTTPTHKTQSTTPKTQLANDRTHNTELQHPCTKHNTSRAWRWSGRRGLSVSGVQIQYSALRTDGRTHLHNTLICCKVTYGNQPRGTGRKHAARDLLDTNRAGTAGRQPRRTGRKPAERNRPGSSREPTAGYRLSGTGR